MSRKRPPISLQPVGEKEQEYSITDTLSLRVAMPDGTTAQVGRGGMKMPDQSGRPAVPSKTSASSSEKKEKSMPASLLQKYQFSDLKMGEVIGEGSQAKGMQKQAGEAATTATTNHAVRKVRHLPTHQLFALKIITFGPGMTKKVLQTELSSCATVDKHPNLVSSLEAYFQEGFLMVLMEFMHYGTLQSVTKKVVEKGKTVPEDVLSKMAAQILAGINHLHTGGGTGRGLIHRDLKPSNVLVNAEGQVKVADFGVATFLSRENQMAFTSIGSTAYMSIAEVAIGHFPMGDARGRMQEDGDQLFGLCVMLAENESCVVWPKKEYYSPELKDFVAQCMMQNPQQRPSAEALLQHPFITKYASKDVDLAGWFKSVMGEKEKKEKSSKKNPPPPPKEHHPPPSASASPPVQPGA